MKNLILVIVIALVLLGAFMLITPSEEKKMDTTPTSTETTAVKAMIETDKGIIELDLYPDVAPKTVANFVEKAKAGYFNGLKFHRVEDFVIQGGDPLSRDDSKKSQWGTGGGDIDTETSDKPFIDGSLGVARGQDIKISNDSQFFIAKGDAPQWTGQYTLFGQVTAGMDIVNQTVIGDVIKSVTIK